MLGIISGVVLQLSTYILRLAEEANDVPPGVASAAEWVASSIVLPLAAAEGTRDLPSVAYDAAEELGRAADWGVATADLPAPITRAVQAIDATGEGSRPGFMSRLLFAGREQGQVIQAIADRIGPVRNFGAVGVIVGGATGTAVSSGLGLPTVAAVQGGGIVGSTIGGSVGIVLGTIIAVLATRFRWVDQHEGE